VVDLLKKLTAANIYRVLSDQQILAANGFADVNLEGFGFISSGAWVALTAICHHLARNGSEICIRLTEPRLRTYMVRSGFFAAVESIVRFEPTIPRLATLNDYEAAVGSNSLIL
jgi:hypothetical protein